MLDPEWQFEDHVRNIAGYVSRIISTLKKAHLHNEGRFIPYQHVMQDGMSYYTTNISVEDVYIINDTKKQEDLSFDSWEVFIINEIGKFFQTLN